MMKARWRWFGLLAVIGVTVAVAAFLAWWKSRLTLYDGKTIRAWAMLVAAPDPKVRDLVHSEFKRLGSNAVPTLSEMVQEKDSALRSGIWLTAPRLPKSLRRLVLRSVSWTNAVEVRLAAARSLAIVGPEAQAAIPALEHAVHDPDMMVRLEAATALGHIGRESVPVLVAALADPDPEVRHAAAYGLGVMGPEAEAAIPALTEALQSTNEEVRASAAHSLSLIQRPRLRQ